ncbi:secretory pathway Sec39 [Corynespora cassiicola Philippines]|uniref:Secretory pathway Sec39 n=1 Tax=Corynespora cassiicola Philippines TaxID=1448308 RepID=A0A2T2NT45_CORCC|nr:secretory pathway Sec39 [Corynespora cassiicola Philippines]
MSEPAKLQQLSAAHCVLLGVHYATEANVASLRALTALRDTDFNLELILQILLTFLPESAHPTSYVEYLAEVASDGRTLGDDPAALLDTSAVNELSASQARRQRKHLSFLPLAYPLYQNETNLDALSQFLIHRSHRIDTETGLLDLIPQLVVPFLDTSEELRTWFISTVLPVLRLGYEYYPQNATPSLDAFARLKGKGAIEYQLSSLRRARAEGAGVDNAARDLKGVVGPWICGANERKRRKISAADRRGTITEQPTGDDDWESLLEWLVHTSREDFSLITSAFNEWDGPEDLDLGGFEEGRDYIPDEQQRHLEVRYAQAALASIYLVEDTSTETLQTAHSLLVRLCNLMSLDSPPDLDIGVESLPSYDLTTPLVQEPTTTILQPDQILRPDNVLTKPDRWTVRVLELLLFSSCLLSSVQYPVSIRDIARLYFRSDPAEQMSVLQKILHPLATGSKRDGEQWKAIRSKLLWLWSWGATSFDGNRSNQGILGLVDGKTVETEILRALLESNHNQLATKTYIQVSSEQPPLPLSDVEDVITTFVMHHYDNATNGNRTRGGMKRASDVFNAFSTHFPSSTRFQRIRALLSATHALSFYSLTLQHGVPFQPVNIRVSSDPLALLRRLLAQNSRSYTHLDDLISIGQNLVISMPSTIMDDQTDTSLLDPATIEKKKSIAERRVIGMAIEAALEEDDFETAYSYVVNRLTPSSPLDVSPAASNSSHRDSFGSYDSSKQDEDSEDVAWRAALQAGRHNSSPASTSWSQAGTTARPDLRRLEQRMELLSQALLLAPPRHLEEVLGVWQQCEAEMMALLTEETEAEQRFNDAADRKLPGAFANETVAVQPRREVGRGAVEEAPMGLFDVARGAAAAFSKSAFPLRGGSQPGSRVVSTEYDNSHGRGSMDMSDSGSMHSGTDDRVRKRDMVASAVTGGLASGIGWVLGATPNQDHDRH